MKSYTDIEQSKKLAEILPLDSSDHHYVRKVCDFRGNAVDGEWSWPKYGNINSKYANYIVQNFTRYEEIPCWSLAALLGVLPKNLDIGRPVLATNYRGGYWVVYFDEYMKETNLTSKIYNNPIDACYELILKLHELKML